MGKSLLLFLFFYSSVFLAAQEPILHQYYNKAISAYEVQDFESYLSHLRKANELRPNHPKIVYKLAGAWALNNRKTRAIQTLNQMLLMDASVDFQSDPDFENIRKYKGYDRLVELQLNLNSVEIHDEVFLQIEAAELHPESFVILPDSTILIGSIREKRIVVVNSQGKYVHWLETPYGVTGMKLSKDERTLWVATAATSEMLGYESSMKGTSVVLQVDLLTGLIIQGLEYNDSAFVGDIEPDNEQRLWVSNSMEAYLSRDDTDTSQYLGAFTRLAYDLTENFFNIQGLTLTDDERYLYFSDYIRGLFRVDIEEGDINQIFAPESSILKGIDGLYFYKNSLLAIHNGTKPYKVVQYFLSEDGAFIELERVINRGGESLGEPTLGQIKEGYFYYLANSPLQAYENGELKIDDWPPIEIRRIKLD